ncbi:hypothetical protein [Sporosarcina sp. P17b]|nr:hypothetical protein [Sporosarcina sp. P17b]
MVGGAMRQPGALPVWLIAEAIHHRRSGANDRPTAKNLKTNSLRVH